jgi:hypothetical protein
MRDLDEAARRYLAWDSILADKDALDLSPHQVRQAEIQKTSADSTVTARLPEAYQWLLVPLQAKTQAEVEWQAYRLTGTEALAVRASKKLRKDEMFVTALAGTRLRMELDRVPLWRGDHVPIRQLVEDFARYLYLPRLKGPEVLIGAIRDGLGLLLWRQESFAYADGFDEVSGRWRTSCACRRQPRRAARAPRSGRETAGGRRTFHFSRPDTSYRKRGCGAANSHARRRRHDRTRNRNNNGSFTRGEAFPWQRHARLDAGRS